MKIRFSNYRTIGRSAASVLAMLTLVLALSSMNAAAAPSAPGKGQPAASPALVQYFQDIDTSNFFYQVTADLYNTGVVSGYTCGTPPAGPCVPPANLPYYVPNNNVTRGLMAIYVDNARTRAGMTIDGRTNNPSSHIPFTTYMTGTNAISLFAEQFGSGSQDNYGSGAQGIVGWGEGDYTQGVFGYGGGTNHSIGVYGYSTSYYGGYFTSTNYAGLYAAGTNSDAAILNSVGGYGLYVNSQGSDAGDFYGNDWGLYVVNNNSGGNHPAGSFYGEGTNSADDALYAIVPTNTIGSDGLYASDGGQGGAGWAVYANGDVEVTGVLHNPLNAGGATAGIMKNVSGGTLERGDVVVISGDSSETIMGSVPAVNIALASQAGDSAVVGIVDAPVYVPDAATAAAYQAQVSADEAAGLAAGKDPSLKAAYAARTSAPGRISNLVGRLHSMPGTTVAAGGYAQVITLGQYATVKVDASFGAIHAGDLLTTSPHAGYAMKANAKAIANGAIIGKALGSLSSGSGTIAVMVTLK